MSDYPVYLTRTDPQNWVSKQCAVYRGAECSTDGRPNEPRMLLPDGLESCETVPYAWRSMILGVPTVFCLAGGAASWPVTRSRRCLYRPDDPRDLDFRIRRIFEDPTLGRNGVEAARARGLKRTEPAATKRLIAAYESDHEKAKRGAAMSNLHHSFCLVYIVPAIWADPRSPCTRALRASRAPCGSFCDGPNAGTDHAQV